MQKRAITHQVHIVFYEAFVQICVGARDIKWNHLLVPQVWNLNQPNGVAFLRASDWTALITLFIMAPWLWQWLSRTYDFKDCKYLQWLKLFYKIYCSRGFVTFLARGWVVFCWSILTNELYCIWSIWFFTQICSHSFWIFCIQISTYWN